MSKQELLDIIRISYLAGIDDTNEDCELWCNEGSAEKALELLEELENDGTLTEELTA